MAISMHTVVLILVPLSVLVTNWFAYRLGQESGYLEGFSTWRSTDEARHVQKSEHGKTDGRVRT